MAQHHANLHHPPVRRRVHLQLPTKNADLENSHPSEQADFERRQRENVGFHGANDRFDAVVSGHGRDGEVLEENAEEKSEGVVC